MIRKTLKTAQSYCLHNFILFYLLVNDARGFTTSLFAFAYEAYSD